MKLEAETEDFSRSNVQLKLYSPAPMLKSLFEQSKTETRAPTKPSRFIVAKNLTTSPMLHRRSGRLQGSNRIRQRPMAIISGDSEHVLFDPASNDSVEQSDSLGEPTNCTLVKLAHEPSAEAKAFLDRIPDLSYMLSSQLSFPAVVSTSK